MRGCVETLQWPLIREGALVGPQTNRETAHLVSDFFSCGCTFGTSWRDYPFLRTPKVHVDPGPANSPALANLIADVKDGLMIDGRGSSSMDQQRYNGRSAATCSGRS
jgi:TldD protein